MEIYEEIIHILDEEKKTVATMESCTGGAVASEITNHPGASEILKFSAVTYSNEYKIKMGVSKEVIDTYSVYSMETAIEMAKNISLFAESNYGIGITGKINSPDPANPEGEDDEIFICIYDADQDTYHEYTMEAIHNLERVENKTRIVKFIGDVFHELLVQK